MDESDLPAWERWPPRRRRPTHRDVARRAGVSPSVVSYVINDGPRSASPSARARVLQAIRELDYHPNDVARDLRSQRTHTVGFFAWDYLPLDVFISPYSAGVLTGLTAALKEAGYYLMAHPVQPGDDLEPLRRLLRSGRLDGVVVRLVEAETSPLSDDLMQLIALAGVPCICVERAPNSRFQFDTVLFDNEAGAYAATNYVMSGGHRRIAHLMGHWGDDSAQARRAGFERAHAERHLALDSRLIQGSSWDPTTVDESIARVMELPQPPTAIFAANDSLAFRAINVLRSAGKSVPRDVAVVGFDDIPLAREMIPALTTVRVPLVEVGRRASLRLTEQIESGKSGSGAIDMIVPKLIRRDTA